MTIHVKNGGVWRDSQPSVRNAGVWKDVQEGYVLNGGVWRKFYQRGLTWNITSSIWPGPTSGSIETVGLSVAEGQGSVTPSPGGSVSLVSASIRYYYAGGTGPEIGLNAEVRINTSPQQNLTGRQLIINGETATCNWSNGLNYIGVMVNQYGAAQPSLWQNLPFLICGYNRVYDPRTYSKSALPFQITLLP